MVNATRNNINKRRLKEPYCHYAIPIHALVTERDDMSTAIVPCNRLACDYCNNNMYKLVGYSGLDLASRALIVYAYSDPVVYWDGLIGHEIFFLMTNMIINACINC